MGEAGRSLRDDRYLKIVNKIKAFGPQSVLDAEQMIRSELAQGQRRRGGAVKST